MSENSPHHLKRMLRASSRLQSHGSQHRPEVFLPVLLSIQHTRATIRRIVAATIHDSRRTVDEPVVHTAHSTIDPGLQLVDVVVWTGVTVFSSSRGVGLHCVQPVEEASDPLQLWWRALLADRVRIAAEVDLGEQSISAFVSCSLAQVEFNLPKLQTPVVWMTPRPHQQHPSKSVRPAGCPKSGAAGLAQPWPLQNSQPPAFWPS